jgi:AAA family ATP:ADP antiporter
LGIQAVLAGPILRRLGVAVGLILLPLVYFISFSALSAEQSLAVLIFAIVAARATTYGITVPSSEVLFTVVSREDKYKSKNFIDTVLRRGSDALAMQLFDRLKSFAAMQTLAFWMLPVTVVWMAVAWTLGWLQRRRAREQPASP